MRAPIPPDELERLAELHELGILDTEPEASFDRIVALAASVLDAPMALVSLVDEDRQWFKAAYGVDVRQTDRDEAFCAHAILEEAILVVSDATGDPRFADMACAAGVGHIRAYAGAVLRGPEGRALGTLCVADRIPRAFTAAQVEQLRLLAGMIEDELRRRARTGADRRALSTLALCDPLTGLPNGAGFRRALAPMLARAEAAGGSVAVARIRAFRLEEVRGALGDAEADEAIAALAGQVMAALPPGTLFARDAGGDFLVAAADPPDVSAIVRSLGGVHRGFEARVGGGPVQVPVAVGLALHPGDGRDADALMRHTSAAVLRAASAPGRFAFHDGAAQERARRALQVEARLAIALDEGRLSLAFQPRFAAASGVPTGAEALLRWSDPVLGPVSPGEFIPVAEGAGLIGRVGSWVLDAAIDRLRTWAANGAWPHPLAVNVSVHQLRQAGFAEDVLRRLAEAGVPAGRLHVEVTESVFAGDAPGVVAELHALAAAGVRVAVDDFGTGYSCMASLRALPVHTLKIDRAFVVDAPESPAARALLGAMGALGRALGMETVVEGVETEAQHAAVVQAGCDHVQGYLLGRPGTEEALLAVAAARAYSPARAPESERWNASAR